MTRGHSGTWSQTTKALRMKPADAALWRHTKASRHSSVTAIDGKTNEVRYICGT